MSTSETEFSFERAMKRVDSYPFLHRFLPVDRFLIRPLASLVVKAVFKTEVTPNQLTKASFVLALLGALLYTGGRHGFFVLGGFVPIGLYFLQLGLYYINLLYVRADRGGEGAEAKSLAVLIIFLVSVAG